MVQARRAVEIQCQLFAVLSTTSATVVSLFHKANLPANGRYHWGTPPLTGTCAVTYDSLLDAVNDGL